MSGGYGGFRVDDVKRPFLAHRVAYEYWVGPIPDDREVHHLCANRACVNPLHLRPVTRKEHMHLENRKTIENTARTHCPQGHPYEGDNLVVRGGGRYCRACAREKDRQWYWRRGRELRRGRRQRS